MIRLMIVDDEATIREGIERSIDWSVINVCVTGTAINGAQTLELCKTSMPDIMLVDVRMPVMDGLTLSGKMHEIAPEVKVIILTGYDEFEYAQKAVEYRVHAYILKPVGAEELVDVVVRLRDRIYGERIRSADPKPPQEKWTAAVLNVYPEDGGAFKNVVTRAVEFVVKNSGHTLGLKGVAEGIFVTPNYLSRAFKQETGMNFLEWLNKFRLETALKYLFDSELKTYEIAQKAGFHNYKHFFHNFKKYFGCSPAEYKRNRGLREK